MWPAIGVEDDQAREMDELLLVEGNRRSAFVESSKKGSAEISFADEFLSAPSWRWTWACSSDVFAANSRVLA